MKEIISQGKLEDGVYFLPNIQIERKKYLDIAKHLQFLGGKWTRGKGGFVFDREISNIDELLGDNIKLKKEIQLFETPEDLADELVDLAEITDSCDTFLEPSAGRGRIIKAIQKQNSCCPIDYCEINETNRKYLDKLEHINFVGDNFLTFKTDKLYSRIIANPPFTKNQDIEHILRMYELLDENGVLVSISSLHWSIGQEKKCQEFRRFLELTKAEIIDIEAGKFKDSGTMVGGKIIVIKK